jgi:small-conductance mechanosensitive channel
MEFFDYIIPGLNFTTGQVLFALVVIVIGVVIGRIARMSSGRVLGSVMSENSAHLVERIIYYTIVIVATLAALSYLGIDFTGALLAGGILGRVIGFATQSVVANLISGIFLQIDKPVSIGDPVSIIDASLYGVILEINVFSTTLRTFDGINLRVPNEKIFTSKIYNFSRHVARRAVITIGIAYKEDMQLAIDIIKKTLNENPLILVDPEPLIYVDELADSSINLSVRAWSASTVWFTVRTQMVQQIKDALDEANIEIPFPQRVIWKGESQEK